ncbi:lytic polysaccharide monooxygenase [Phytohabitans sp. ZYX-F-186]|uniref:Lytic polysaccharide monooxygenase n=1 Tax=Phytohabitans maris TaxID=3071409 RepID=A0ABU0ZEZ4_9ACTN|nr:lytic polysaccharide monooxygenase [Phytohabitans sp. ZYX-F-186]MDQ7905626.1 lytic polysaccharide monooxygenase [Phytohabitans sp. ZYX-F-186]
MKVLYALAAAALVVLAAPAPARAHGALTSPVSRLAACGTEGTSAGSAACQAALSASGRQRWADWDNLRLPGVDGRDREVIPDGKLCSAGIDRYAGLDLARADWPATRLTSGASFAFAYRSTIPHEGRFKLYVTRDGYDPEKPLAWSDLESKPFLSVADPAFRDEAYRMKGTLPADKSGRHLIYTIWQNSSTPDTYYSCSDVIFTKPAAKPAKATKAAAPVATELAEPPAPTEPVAPTEIQAEPEPVSVTNALPLVGGGAAVIVVLGALYAVLLKRRRG